jgi:hypothetical protein
VSEVALPGGIWVIAQDFTNNNKQGKRKEVNYDKEHQETEMLRSD